MFDKRSLLTVLVCCALLGCGGGGPRPLPEPTQDPKPDPQTPVIGGQEPAPNGQNPVLAADLGGEASGGGEGGASPDDH
ncbi:MAG TPA: hypothetical protein VER96_23685 [Polyangiaceae bacterium]|nr:hypothetical protein [Polyangiaceae bacterium]